MGTGTSGPCGSGRGSTGVVGEPGEKFTDVLVPCEGVSESMQEGEYVLELEEPGEAEPSDEMVLAHATGAGCSGGSTQGAGASTTGCTRGSGVLECL